ncbi:NADPH:quinone reductase-like Zn-dependent oxidoreductase [Kitasatospora gansuensis]|uniref:NADPH:quinone reductase-like Zn-dependent oxidoreductase n=1 Tax=Kitasatospora gansuensis TaxID=258050 RepID=A0A7W7WI17_9ACTN|nr:NADP-dependent oxidoreductase [Kitasatospora gansuensis]MBB4947791.1 NADPH:quinone reductase-like Zn-dependent oxidoreductase [Kitasatospora gansuensis]
MRAVTVRTFGCPEVIELADAPLPQPGPDELRIRTRASAVHPADLAVRSGAVAHHLPAEPSFRLGWDVAGEVDAVGEGVTGFRPGDRVIGLSHWFATRNGTHAEYVVLAATAVAPVPAGVPDTVAGALPLNGLTALQAVEATGLTRGQTLLVTGAAGNLGGLVVQLAVAQGLRVIALARPEDHEFVTGHGARHTDAVTPGEADAVVDTALLGAAVLPALRDGAAFVAVRPGPLAVERGIRHTVLNVRPDSAQLAELGELVAAGRLTVRIAAEHPYTEAAKAHEQAEQGGLRGAVVLTF